MRRLILITVLLAAFQCFNVSGGVSGNVSAAAPKRIVSLKPNITEILFALGAGERVVGVTSWCDYPEEAKKLPKVADYININTEKIIALEPDIVISSEENSIKGQFAVLQSAGIKTATAPFRTLDDLYGSVAKIAEIVGKKEDGEKLVKKIAGSMPQGPANRRTALILVGRRPLVAAGTDTFYGDMIKAIGAKNIVDGKTPYPTINTEFITAKNPDVIIDLAMGSETSTELPEILKNKVVRMNMSEFRAGPRIGEAAKKLNETLKHNALARD